MRHKKRGDKHCAKVGGVLCAPTPKTPPPVPPSVALPHLLVFPRAPPAHSHADPTFWCFPRGGSTPPRPPPPPPPPGGGPWGLNTFLCVWG